MAIREIDERVSDNIRVTAYYDDLENTLTIEVEDLLGSDLKMDRTITGVPVEDFDEAFNHPFTYQRKAAA